MNPTPSVGLVDDDPALRRALTRLLSAGGFSVRAFSSAAELLISLNAPHPPPPDCLILDVQMPDTGGLDLLDLLNAAGLDIPVVFLTGHGTIPLTVRAMKNGALNVLTKPVDDTDLFAAVHAALATAATRKAHHSRIADARRRLASLCPPLRSACPACPCDCAKLRALASGRRSLLNSRLPSCKQRELIS